MSYIILISNSLQGHTTRLHASRFAFYVQYDKKMQPHFKISYSLQFISNWVLPQEILKPLLCSIDVIDKLPQDVTSICIFIHAYCFQKLASIYVKAIQIASCIYRGSDDDDIIYSQTNEKEQWILCNTPEYTVPMAHLMTCMSRSNSSQLHEQ